MEARKNFEKVLQRVKNFKKYFKVSLDRLMGRHRLSMRLNEGK